MKSPELTDLQVAFHDHLLNLPSTISQEVSEGGHIGVDHRLHIYHNAYRARLLENLQDAYEKTWAYLGDETFESSALAFIEDNPPRHRNLRWHGAAFPQWLAERFLQDQDIAELALIDWQLRLAFDGPNATPVQPAELAGFLEVEQLAPVGGYFRLMSRRLLNGLQFFPGLAFPIAALLLVPPALVLPWLDGLDKAKNFTLGYVCVARKPQ